MTMQEVTLYEVYFNLRSRPFDHDGAGPVWLSPTVAACAADLIAALHRRAGLILLVGPASRGMAALIRRVLDEIRRVDGAACAAVEAGAAGSGPLDAPDGDDRPPSPAPGPAAGISAGISARASAALDRLG